jgi:hypothetical protein
VQHRKESITQWPTTSKASEFSDIDNFSFWKRVIIV